MFLVQMSRSREAELGEEVALLEQEKQELQYSISLLEVDNQTLRDEIQQLRGEAASAATTVSVSVRLLEVTDVGFEVFSSLADSERQDFIILKCPPTEETGPEEPERRDSLLEEQLRHTQEKLCIKESEVDSGIIPVM